MPHQRENSHCCCVEIASAFGVAVQLKCSSRMLRNTFVQHLIMVAEHLGLLKYI
jgi:hypothetical protein